MANEEKKGGINVYFQYKGEARIRSPELQEIAKKYGVKLPRAACIEESYGKRFQNRYEVGPVKNFQDYTSARQFIDETERVITKESHHFSAWHEESKARFIDNLIARVYSLFR